VRARCSSCRNLRLMFSPVPIPCQKLPIKDAASAALMLINCLDKAGIISEAEKQSVHSRARIFLADATLKDAA
jgi:hypothetical protein